MQATAMAPISIDVADCPADVVAHERQIAVEAMKQDPKNANKPDAILEKIAEGKMRKFFEENTLLNQLVVGEKETIAELIRKADNGGGHGYRLQALQRWRHSFSGRRSSGFRASLLT